MYVSAAKTEHTNVLNKIKKRLYLRIELVTMILPRQNYLIFI